MSSDIGVCPKCKKHPIQGVPTPLVVLGSMLMGVGGAIVDAIYLSTRGYRCQKCGSLSMDEVPEQLRKKYHINVGFSIFVVIVLIIGFSVIASLI